MKFIRLICLSYESPPEDGRSIRLPANINDFTISHFGSYKKQGEFLSIWTFQKDLSESDYSLSMEQLTINSEYLDLCHRIVRFFASYLSVVHQVKLVICSPMPSFAIVPDTTEETSSLKECEGMNVNRDAIHGEEILFEFDGDAFQLTCDRPEGLEALAEALRLNSDLAKYREYIRLFEMAFAHSGIGLYKPLLRFLSSGKAEFTKDEVRDWFDRLRSRAIHSDREEPIFGFEIAKSMVRMKLAAYDVLFNKVNWKSHDHSRRKGLIPISGPGFITQGKQGMLVMRLFDDFGAFPMNLNAGLQSLPKEWWSKVRSNSAPKPSPKSGTA